MLEITDVTLGWKTFILLDGGFGHSIPTKEITIYQKKAQLPSQIV